MTVYYAVLSVPLGQGFALLAAVILNAKLRGVEAFRAAWYLPAFWLAWVWRCCGHGCSALTAV